MKFLPGDPILFVPDTDFIFSKGCLVRYIPRKSVCGAMIEVMHKPRACMDHRTAGFAVTGWSVIACWSIQTVYQPPIKLQRTVVIKL